VARIAVIGSGYVGTVTAACFAWTGHEVRGVDVDSSRVQQLQAGHVPFHEPGLDLLLRAALDTGRLCFTSDMGEGARGAGTVFLCVGTPPGALGQPDLSQVESAVRALAPHLGQDVVLASKSTVPVGSGSWLRSFVEDLRPDLRGAVTVVSNPEFLREGSAIEDFLHPDRVVVGGEEPARGAVADLYRPVLTQAFAGGHADRRPDLVLTDLPSAELLKYAANAFLAMKISFANEMAAVCERVGADVTQVTAGLGADHRIGHAFLGAGLGWGGSCFGKDVAALSATALEYGEQTPLLRAVVEVNRSARGSVVRRLQAELRLLKGRRVAVLGLSFKPGTDDLRDSPSLDVVQALLRAGCTVSVHDPVVKDLPDGLGDVRVAVDAYDAASRADAVVLVTGWPEHAALDLQSLADSMCGRVVLDGRNCLDPAAAEEAGLRLLQIGR
jgi:UDPglucose 6-dehydrogenase